MTLDLAVRASVLLALALTATRLLGRASAATRHACWRVAMTATLALPVVSAMAPAWEVPASVVVPFSSEVRSLGARRGGDGGQERSDAPAGDARGRSEAQPYAWRVRSSSAEAMWLAGTVLVSIYIASGHVRLRRVRRRALPAPLTWTASAARLAARLRLPAAPDVAVSSAVRSPIVTGVWRPAVIIPVEAAGWNATRRETVLLHELAHVARRDVAAQAVAHIVCALHWFNPLAWIALGRMRRERERACDDAVLGSGIAASTYAAELLAVAAGAMTSPTPAAALSMARPSEIEGRLLSILAVRPRRMTAMARLGVPAIASVALLLIAGAAAPAATAGPDAQRTPLATTGQSARALWILPDAERFGRDPATGSTREWPRHSIPESREREVVSLGLTSGTEVIPALIAALGDAHSGVREKAVVGLMWRRDARVVPALIDAAKDRDGGVRKKAIVALALTGDARAAPVLDAARRDEDAGVRDAAEKLSLLR